jgi:hypothetical protein
MPNDIDSIADANELREKLREAWRENGKLRTRLKLYESMKALTFKQEAELSTLRRKAHADECRLNRLQKLHIVVRKVISPTRSEFLSDWLPGGRIKTIRRFIDRLPKDPIE